MRFVEEENEFRLFRIANLRQSLKEFGKQPEKKRRVNFRRLLHQFLGRQDIDYSTSTLGLDEIIEVERRFTKKLVGALRFQFEQTALDRSGACRRNVAIFCFELVGVVGDVLQHRAKVLQIEQQQTALVGNLENHVEDARLRVVQAEQTTEQQRPHLRYGRAHGMSVLAEHIPEHHGTGFTFEIRNSEFLCALDDLWIGTPSLAHARRDHLSRPP